MRAPEGTEATAHEEDTEKCTTAPKTLETGVTDQQAQRSGPEFVAAPLSDAVRHIPDQRRVKISGQD
ncbi:uncharacterized [Tachysurus ichikawai]